MTKSAEWDLDKFEQQWTNLAEVVVSQLLANPEIQQIKDRVRAQGHLQRDDREQFIKLVNKIKYEVIYKQFGPEGSDGYNIFEDTWQQWMKLKATDMPKPQNMYEDNIHHLLLGSTPNPDKFLKDFDLNNDPNQ